MDFKKIAVNNSILLVRVGSHLFGTNTPDSDLDMVGIFMPPEELLYGFQHRCEEVDLSEQEKDDTGRNTKDAIDYKIYEYRKFVKLLTDNNPNIVHIIFANPENIILKSSFADALFDRQDWFIHKGAYHRFSGYAYSQLHKMKIKPQNYADLENGLQVLEYFDSHEVLADVINAFEAGDWNLAKPFKDNGHGKHIKCGDLFFERGIFVKKARKMIKERLSKASNRAELFTKFGYDVKFASNLIQLSKEAIELMKTGRIEFPLTYAQDILDVKNGKYSAEQIYSWAEELNKEAEDAYNNSKLPHNPDRDKIERFAISEIKRWLNE